jgi:hypothetical protein
MGLSSYTYSFSFLLTPHYFRAGIAVASRDDSGSCLLLNASASNEESEDFDNNNLFKEENHMKNRREALRRISLWSVIGLSQGAVVGGAAGNQNFATADETTGLTTFESIAERASQLSPKATGSTSDIQSRETTTDTAAPNKKSIYDFEVPVSGKQVPVRELVTREINGEVKQPKAILVVNIKQDDPIARKNMPQLISLGSR